MGSIEEVIEDYMPLVKNIASKFNVSNIGMEYDDLVSVGTIGLMDAYNKYSADKGSKFSTYATLRVRSYIIDEIRKLSPITRTDMDKIKKYNECVDSLSIELQRSPKSIEIANKLGVTQKDIKSIEHSLSILNTLSVDSLIESTETNIINLSEVIEGDIISPSDLVLEEEKINILANCIKELDEREQIILSLYYYEELTLKEVGLVLGLSESRVCVLHNKTLKKLKKIIEGKNYKM